MKVFTDQDEKYMLDFFEEGKVIDDTGRVDIMTLSMLFGIIVMELDEPLSFQSGFISRLNEVSDIADPCAIIVNINMSNESKRFYIAKELAHWIMYDTENTVSDNGNKAFIPAQDRMADCTEMANNLLMPKIPFMYFVNDMREDHTSPREMVKILAEQFEVPFQSILQRGSSLHVEEIMQFINGRTMAQ